MHHSPQVKAFTPTWIFAVIAISLCLRLICINATDLLVEEAYYWNYAQHLDFSYLDHPPMVAALIRLFTLILGPHEFSVRFASLCCWLVTAFFSHKLTTLLKPGAGIYAVMLLAILPFYFLQSLIITPDQPLTACWAGALYCLFRALVLKEPPYWYASGVWLGLGLLSKYTIVLLGPAVLWYVLTVPHARFWLRRNEPYLCLLLASLLFTPVIYWNATHAWASFIFQSSRRFKDHYSFSLHEYLGLVLLFLMPIGVVNLFSLLRCRSEAPGSIYFLQCFTVIPLLFFGLFSLTHPIKFNWIGPGLLALIPWVALNLKSVTETLATQDVQRVVRKIHAERWIPKRSRESGSSMNLFLWFFTAIALLICYSGMIEIITLGRPEAINKTLFNKFISWRDLTTQFYSLAQHVEADTHSTPIFVPLDKYNINSELAYYQAMLSNKGSIQAPYPIQGRHIFGRNSLMYRYWLPKHALAGESLILISTQREDFNAPSLSSKVVPRSTIQSIWAHSQGKHSNIRPYYYQVVQIKP
ncbi:MAG: glycosyltransferase family 39 protein [Gammaproteobacteria bacterium]|nr:glycosyltransferase family 39 protein [Gammaproteobacteria bacterium]